MKSWVLGSALLSVVVFGASVFMWAIASANAARAWQVFFVNLLFFSAIAQSGPVLAALYHLTEARWGARIMPLAVGLGSFLPISFVLFVVLLVSFPYLPKYSPEFPARQAWFDPLFLVGRDILGIAILYSVSLVFSYRFLNSTHLISYGGSVAASRNISTSVEARRESQRVGDGHAQKLTPLAVLVLGLYAVVYSLIGFDLVMGLDQQWYSTLFGGYFFISSFYIGLTAITLTVILARICLAREELVQANTLWDLGKLVFAFCLLTAYFFWAQYLVSWYGNLPEEIGFFTRRLQDPTWAGLSWTAISLTFAVPFLALLPQRAKQSSAVLCSVAGIALVGMWLERYVLIAPSLDLAPFGAGWTEVIITSSFLAAMVFSYRAYLQRYPLPE